MERTNPIEEAQRYVANAEEVIKKANYDPELNIYTDGKYVKMAGNGKGRPAIEKYKEAAGKRDRKLLAAIVAGYDTMHLVMGYDGNKSKKVCEAGFDYAKTIIERCALLYPGTECA